MANWIGLGGSNTKKSKVHGLQIQSSILDAPIPIGWGKNRIAPNLIWQADFQQHGGSGGKGLGGKGGAPTYTVSVLMALGEGVISNVDTVYINQSTSTLNKLGLSLRNGTADQPPSGYITAHHPTQALSYAYTAYLEGDNYSIGNSPTVPMHAFECEMKFCNSMPGTPDANFGDIIPDLLTSTQYGMGMAQSDMDAVDLAFFKTYQTAQGLFFSPVLSSQEKATDIINRWAMLANSWICWSGDRIRFIPLGDSPITANGVTYTPDTSVRLALTTDHFLDTAQPVLVSRMDPADAYNRTRLEISDRTLQYNARPIEYKDGTLVDLYGIRDASSIQAHEICDAAVGLKCVTLIGQRTAYLRNTYKWKLSFRFIILEVGDVVTLTEPNIGLDEFPVRINKIGEDDNGDLNFEAEEFPGTLGTVTTGPLTTGNQNPTDFSSDPGNTNPPCIVEPNSGLVGSTPQVWIAASGGANWGGCDVLISFDNINFTPVGTITGRARQGVLTQFLPSDGSHDAGNFLKIDLTESVGTLDPPGTLDGFFARTLSYIAKAPVGNNIQPGGEFLSYQNLNATGTYKYTLSNMYRALYGTTSSNHAVGDQFTRIDNQQNTGSLFKYNLPAQYIGQPVYVKLPAFNQFDAGHQDASAVTAWVYSPVGTGFGGGAGGVPLTPAGLTAVSGAPGSINVSWLANPATDNVSSYQLWRATGTGASFAAASLVQTTAALGWTDTNLTIGAGYTYFLRAVNAAGVSPVTAGVNVIAGSTGATLALRPSGSLETTYSAGQVLMNIPMRTGDFLPAGLPGSQLVCTIAPAGNVALKLYKNGVQVGTGNITAGATTGTWTLSSSVSFNDSDRLKFTAPDVADANLSGVGWLLAATRTQ